MESQTIETINIQFQLTDETKAQTYKLIKQLTTLHTELVVGLTTTTVKRG